MRKFPGSPALGRPIAGLSVARQVGDSGVCCVLVFPGQPSPTSIPSSGFLKQVSSGATRRINHLQSDFIIPVGVNCPQSAVNGQQSGQHIRRDPSIRRGERTEKAGEHSPAFSIRRRTTYRLILRRTTPTAPTSPVPSRSKLDGSGVVAAVEKPNWPDIDSLIVPRPP
jgi:hypothetical protein